MRNWRQLVALGGLSLGMTFLAACGGTSVATNTVPAAATTAASAAPSAQPTTAPAASATTGTAATRAATTATTGTTPAAATATRAATSSAATATRASTATGGTATRTASPTTNVTPAQAVTNLQRLDNSRQAWVFSGFSVAGLSGNLSPVFEYNGGNQKVTLAAGGTNIEAYQVGGALYARAPIGGVIQVDGSNPLAAPAQALFATPSALFTALVPAGASYTIAGTETVNGQQATRYTTSVTLTDLGFVNPALAGQGGTANTTVWVGGAQGVVVAMQSTITPANAGTTATARLDVTNIGTTPAIAIPR